jgi:hypothetical protein
MTQNHKEEQQENELQAQICVETGITGALKPVVNCTEPEVPQSEDPHPATVAALEFQVAWLLNDSHSSVAWPGHGNLVVNTPGGLKKKYETLCRIAEAHFPSRGDTIDVLDQTIDEYGLGGWANPFGFWTAFKHDMMDAAKKADEAKCVPFETGSRTSSDRIRSRNNCHEWKPSEGSHNHEEKQARQWLNEKYSEISTTETPAVQKWKNVIASDNPLDRLIAEAYRRVLADEGVMDNAAGTKRQMAGVAPVVLQICLLSRCSQAQAYRFLEKFRKQWAGGRRKS